MIMAELHQQVLMTKPSYHLFVPRVSMSPIQEFLKCLSLSVSTVGDGESLY